MEKMVREIDHNFWKDKRVFVTGHTGFKGSWLISWLLQLGSEVMGYSLPISKENYLYSKIKHNLDKNIDQIFSNILKREFLNVEDLASPLHFCLVKRICIVLQNHCVSLNTKATISF